MPTNSESAAHQSKTWQRGRLSWGILGRLLAAVVLAAVASAVRAEEGPRVFELDPYDQITLTEANGGGVFRIAPLENRGTVRPANNAGDLRVRLLERPEHQFDVAWKDIARLEVFEDLALAEAEKLVAAGKFDEAYDYFRYCLQHHPFPSVVQAARERYLYLNAGRYFQEKRFAHALGLLEELYRLNPRFKLGERGLLVVLNGAADRLLETLLAAADYAAVRRLTGRLDTTYGESLKPLVDKWRTRLNDLAATHLVEARKYFAAGKFRQAHEAARAMLGVSPQVPGGRELARQIAERFPVAVVGVMQPLPAEHTGSLSAWAAARGRRVLVRPLVEFAGFGSEGARFISPWGELAPNDDRTQLTFHLKSEIAAAPSAFEVSHLLLQAASENSEAFEPHWAQLMASVSVTAPHSLNVRLRRSALLPEAWLPQGNVPAQQGAQPPASGNEPASGAAPAEVLPRLLPPEVPYSREANDPRGLRLVLNERYAFLSPTMPREIEERPFANSQEALRALRRGEVDIVDQVFPADVELAKRDAQISVEAYATVSLHFLIPNYARAVPSSRSFRRALEYALDREAILSQVLLGGRGTQGCQVLTGPFSPGKGANDPAGYAYNTKVEARRYEPRLALALATLARRELADEAQRYGQKPPAEKKLVIVYPPGEVPQLATLAIARQLAAIGIECETKEWDSQAPLAPEGNWDFAYYCQPAGDPLVDAPALFGARGLARSREAYVNLALRKLFDCRRLDEAREQVRRLHQVVADDVTLVPLWQLVEHFAYRNRVQGIGAQPASLYAHVEQWQVLPAEVE